MNAPADPLRYPYDTSPAPGSTLEVAPGVRWLQMPLPMSLNHINLYLLEDTDGWYVVDTGLRGDDTRQLWQQIFDGELGGKPVKQVICTHMHPDHTGQAGFISEYWRAPLAMSYSEYYQARVMTGMMRDGESWQMSDYFVRAGVDPAFLQEMRRNRGNFTPEPEDKPFPGSFLRLSEGDVLTINGREWEIITGNGHSPEHVCLYCPELRILLSGDQILPVITSNVSVHPTEPYGNPMLGWLESHERFKRVIPNDVLVLPAHNAPFYGVQERLQQLIYHHEDRMLVLEENCVEPRIATDLLPFLFKRKLEGHSLFMALGECIAHLNCLISRNRIERILEGDIYKYHSIDPTLKDRARPGQHEEPDEAPTMV
ncbi:MAG: MBL fold metallo-hydrolase [Pseudomonadales bacterium]|nr:MBL fold metallo-hydrolase [Pseudomonadales bacterium]